MAGTQTLGDFCTDQRTFDTNWLTFPEYFIGFDATGKSNRVSLIFEGDVQSAWGRPEVSGQARWHQDVVINES